MKYTVVVPYVLQSYFDEFEATLKIPRENCLFVDNTADNIGIMASHNLGVAEMYRRNADYLIVMSAACRFGQQGGLDFIKTIEEHPEALMIHGAGKWFDPGEGIEKVQALGFHLTAMKREIFDAVGNFDENFSNYSLDDTDLYLRIQKHFGKDYRLEVYPVDFSHASTSHSISLAGIKGCAYAPRNEYFKRKHGRDGGEWQKEGYDRPFNDPTKPLSYWPTPNDPLSIHQVEFKQGYNFND
jgi:hypothetical protein